MADRQSYQNLYKKAECNVHYPSEKSNRLQRKEYSIGHKNVHAIRRGEFDERGNINAVERKRTYTLGRTECWTNRSLLENATCGGPYSSDRLPMKKCFLHEHNCAIRRGEYSERSNVNAIYTRGRAEFWTDESRPIFHGKPCSFEKLERLHKKEYFIRHENKREIRIGEFAERSIVDAVDREIVHTRERTKYLTDKSRPIFHEKPCSSEFAERSIVNAVDRKRVHTRERTKYLTDESLSMSYEKPYCVRGSSEKLERLQKMEYFIRHENKREIKIGEFAERSVVDAVERMRVHLGADDKEPMCLISRFEFENYLVGKSNPISSKRSFLRKETGEHDILLLHLNHGVIFIQVKAIGEFMQVADSEKEWKAVKKRKDQHNKKVKQFIERALKQLNRDEQVFRRFMKDLKLKVPIRKVLALPNIRRATLANLSSSVAVLAQHLGYDALDRCLLKNEVNCTDLTDTSPLCVWWTKNIKSYSGFRDVDTYKQVIDRYFSMMSSVENQTSEVEVEHCVTNLEVDHCETNLEVESTRESDAENTHCMTWVPDPIPVLRADNKALLFVEDQCGTGEPTDELDEKLEHSVGLLSVNKPFTLLDVFTRFGFRSWLLAYTSTLFHEMKSPRMLNFSIRKVLPLLNNIRREVLAVLTKRLDYNAHYRCRLGNEVYCTDVIDKSALFVWWAKIIQLCPRFMDTQIIGIYNSLMLPVTSKVKVEHCETNLKVEPIGDSDAENTHRMMCISDPIPLVRVDSKTLLFVEDQLATGEPTDKRNEKLWHGVGLVSGNDAFYILCTHLDAFIRFGFPSWLPIVIALFHDIKLPRMLKENETIQKSTCFYSPDNKLDDFRNRLLWGGQRFVNKSTEKETFPTHGVTFGVLRHMQNSGVLKMFTGRIQVDRLGKMEITLHSEKNKTNSKFIERDRELLLSIIGKVGLLDERYIQTSCQEQGITDQAAMTLILFTVRC